MAGPHRRSPTSWGRALVEYGYAVTVGDRWLAAPVAATERVLVWRGWPMLGGAYEWALAGVEYARHIL
ncbi:hypothetical protein ACOZ4F_00245 (plasmid) [Haloarcula marismortui]|uniref:hypothetical protein n=1 Tax=Haloarcula marismortui TaxID=2238 RepID=UPI003C78A310